MSSSARGRLGPPTFWGVLLAVGLGLACVACGSDGPDEEWTPSPLASLGAKLPEKLSDLGVYEDLPSLEPGSRVFTFDVKYPLWTDGAEKQRLIWVPRGTSVSVDTDGSFSFPQGTVIAKTSSSPEMPEGRAHERIQTQIFYKNKGKWKYVAYVWQEDGQDAQLTDGEEHILDFGLPTSPEKYIVFDRFTCLRCHGSAKLDAFILGFAGWQLTDASLKTLQSAGVLPGKDLPGRTIPARSDIERKALGFIGGNCSHCHRPGAAAFVGNELDLRYQNVINSVVGKKPQRLTEPKARIIVDPGKPDGSVLYRLVSREYEYGNQDPVYMPQVGSHTPDPQGLETLRAWIESLGG